VFLLIAWRQRHAIEVLQHDIGEATRSIGVPVASSLSADFGIADSDGAIVEFLE
jgi:hypothetical protein